MNYVHIINGERIESKGENCLFCKKRIGEGHDSRLGNKCTRFLLEIPDDQWTLCPFGLYAKKNGQHCFCGLLLEHPDAVNSPEQLKKTFHLSEFSKLDNGQKEIVGDILADESWIESYSCFVHDFVHSIGYLKTHIDACQMYNSVFPMLDSVVSYYREVISIYNDAYAKRVVERPRIDSCVRLQNLSSILEAYRRKKSQYTELIDGLRSSFSKGETIVNEALDSLEKHNLQEQVRKKIQSLLYMNGFFLCLLEYADNRVMMMGNASRGSKSSGKYEMAIYPMVRKLVYLLENPAYYRNLQGIYLEGHSDLRARVSPNLYLGLFILLENALKYALRNTRIDVRINDTDDGDCVVSIANDSEPISQESLRRLKERGFSGENSVAKESNGIGLAIADEIFSEPETDFRYKFSEGIFTATLQIRCEKRNFRVKQ